MFRHRNQTVNVTSCFLPPLFCHVLCHCLSIACCSRDANSYFTRAYEHQSDTVVQQLPVCLSDLAGNENHLHMLVETSAISADSHVCSGLLSPFEKQLEVNKRKQSAYTCGRPLSKWHQIADFISLSLFLSLCAATLNSDRNNQLRVFKINAGPSAYQRSRSLKGITAVFLFASSDFISVLTLFSEIQ